MIKVNSQSSIIIQIIKSTTIIIINPQSTIIIQITMIIIILIINPQSSIIMSLSDQLQNAVVSTKLKNCFENNLISSVILMLNNYA